MVEIIKISDLKGLDFELIKSDKHYNHALSIQIKKLNQIIIPTVFFIKGCYHLATNHQEVSLMSKYGVKELKVLIIESSNELDFKIFRLALQNINLEFDAVNVSESIRELTRQDGQKNISSLLGVSLELYESYEKLLDFDWGFKSKKEKKVTKNPNQLGIDWDF